ncbi:head-binding protein, partial [Shigella flexneri]
CEGNGTQGDSSTGGAQLAINGLNGSCALVLNNPYFEANAGGADLAIDNTGTRPVTVVINGGNFHRVSSARYTHTNIQVTSSGGGKLQSYSTAQRSRAQGIISQVQNDHTG